MNPIEIHARAFVEAIDKQDDVAATAAAVQIVTGFGGLLSRIADSLDRLGVSAAETQDTLSRITDSAAEGLRR